MIENKNIAEESGPAPQPVFTGPNDFQSPPAPQQVHLP